MYTAMTLATPQATTPANMKPHGIQFGTVVLVALVIWGICWLLGIGGGRNRH